MNLLQPGTPDRKATDGLSIGGAYPRAPVSFLVDGPLGDADGNASRRPDVTQQFIKCLFGGFQTARLLNLVEGGHEGPLINLQFLKFSRFSGKESNERAPAPRASKIKTTDEVRTVAELKVDPKAAPMP